MNPYDAGARFIETLWYTYATRIVNTIIEMHKIDDKTADELRQKYLKRGDYCVKAI